MPVAKIEMIEGDLLDQPVEAIVNPWNRNFFPWWLLLPQGVSGEIRRRAGTAPFRELRQCGVLKPGAAVATGAGRLPYDAIIHVAGLNGFWRSSETIVRQCVSSALTVGSDQGCRSIGLPLIGAGTGGMSPDRSQSVIADVARQTDYSGSSSSFDGGATRSGSADGDEPGLLRSSPASEKACGAFDSGRRAIAQGSNVVRSLIA